MNNRSYLISVMFQLLTLLIATAGIVTKRLNKRSEGSPTETRILQATVRVANGTGCIVGQSGDGDLIILSAKHVGAGAVSLWPHDQWQGQAQVIAEHPHADQILLKLPYRGSPPGHLRISDRQPNGGTLISAGCPNGANPTCAVHRIVGKTSYPNYVGIFYYTNQRAYPGCSGGPLVDSRGKVVGVCCFTNDRSASFSSLAEIHALCRIAGLARLYE